jgi:hypothetical protein
MKSVYRILVEHLNEIYLEDRALKYKIILKAIFRKSGHGPDSSASEQGPVMELCEHVYNT